MQTSRLEAFSDGVLAIIITIMVLELDLPDGHTLADLWKTTGTDFLTYLLSFVYVGIYWNNHHHMFQLTQRINGRVLWANLHLLFWLSVLPFSTAWMDESEFARAPVMAYGTNLLAAAIAYFVLQTVIVRGRDGNVALSRAVGRDVKGKLSPVLYVTGILCASFIDADAGPATFLAMLCFVVVAAMWLVPDRRIERAVAEVGNAP
jgi:uncharacterized membrane protein